MKFRITILLKKLKLKPPMKVVRASNEGDEASQAVSHSTRILFMIFDLNGYTLPH